ncbi:hypothetical protein KYT24_004368 [Salmonella enterica]|nr:hypothetical protein [Salmonella enterica]
MTRSKQRSARAHQKKNPFANQGGSFPTTEAALIAELTPATERAKRHAQRRRVAREAREMLEQEGERLFNLAIEKARQQREAMPEPEHRRTKASMLTQILALKAKGLSDRDVALELGLDVNDVTAKREIFLYDYDTREEERRKREGNSITRQIWTLEQEAKTRERWGA